MKAPTRKSSAVSLPEKAPFGREPSRTPSPPLAMEAKLTAASELAESKPAAAAAQFEALIVDAETSEDAIKVKESA